MDSAPGVRFGAGPRGKPSKRQRHKRWIQPRARGSARAQQEGGRSAREGPRKATRRKTQPASTRRSEPGGASLEPGSRFAPFSNSISGLGGSRARVGARRSQAGARLKSANLPYEEPFSPDPPHLLNIILFKRWGDQRKAACRPAEVSPSRILKGGSVGPGPKRFCTNGQASLSRKPIRPRAEANLYNLSCNGLLVWNDLAEAYAPPISKIRSPISKIPT